MNVQQVRRQQNNNNKKWRSVQTSLLCIVHSKHNQLKIYIHISAAWIRIECGIVPYTFFSPILPKKSKDTRRWKKKLEGKYITDSKCICKFCHLQQVRHQTVTILIFFFGKECRKKSRLKYSILSVSTNSDWRRCAHAMAHTHTHTYMDMDTICANRGCIWLCWYCVC